MKLKRAAERDKRGPAARSSVHTMPSASPRLICPTIEQLNQHAERMHAGTLNVPVEIAGILPEWTSPYDDIFIAKQGQIEPPEWNMIAERFM